MKRILHEVTQWALTRPALRGLALSHKEKGELKAWERQGRPVPPPHAVKQDTLRHYAKQHGLKVLVETGTHYGDMVAAMQSWFEKIYSIELSRHLHEFCLRRFGRHRKIELIHGDSGIELGRLLPVLGQPALFWLDGHYSGGITARGAKDTPIYEELEHILASRHDGHVIIVDDARCFGSEPSYPTIADLSAFVRARAPQMEIAVEDDSIRITPAPKR